MNSPSRQRRALDAATVLARWAVGALFLYMGLAKALDPEKFLKLVRQYDLVSTPWLLNGIAAALPWLEVWCGLLLLTGILVRGSALLSLAMLIPFTAVVFHRATVLAAAKALPFCAVKFDCGCGTGEVLICGKLVENGALIFLSAWLLTGYGRQLCLRYSLRLADPAG